MKALVKSQRARGLQLQDIPEPEIGINDVLIRVSHTGICGTDLHIYEWDEWAQATIPVPMAIGHEFVGEIVQVGSNVNDFHPGEIVSGEGHVVCGRCRNCLAGRRHLCAHTMGVGVNRSGAFRAIHCFAHDQHLEVMIPASIAKWLPSSIPLATPSTPLLSFPTLGEDVLITGAGPIGLMAVAIARHAAARHIVVTDLKPFSSRSSPQKLGATLAVDPTVTSLAEAQKQLGMQEGFDVGLEMSGSPAAFRDMIANMSHGAKIAMLGIPAKEMAINWRQMSSFNMLTIKGIYGRERCMRPGTK